MGKVDKINEIIRINEINRVSRIKRIHRINGIKSSHQQNIYCMCTLLRIFSVVYIFPEDNFFFFFLLFVKKTKREKKACILAPYQDALIFSLLKGTKND